MTKYKQTKVNIYVLIPELTLSHRLCLEIYHRPDVNLGGFRSQPGASHLSKHTEELSYSETDSLEMAIYIYVYICMYVRMYVCMYV